MVMSVQWVGSEQQILVYFRITLPRWLYIYSLAPNLFSDPFVPDVAIFEAIHHQSELLF